MIDINANPSDGAPPRGKAEVAKAAFGRMLGELSRRGYYGSVTLTLSVQDGAIQHVRVATDQMVK